MRLSLFTLPSVPQAGLPSRELLPGKLTLCFRCAPWRFQVAWKHHQRRLGELNPSVAGSHATEARPGEGEVARVRGLRLTLPGNLDRRSQSHRYSGWQTPAAGRRAGRILPVAGPPRRGIRESARALAFPRL